MNPNLALCLALQRAHASLRLKLDDELGIYHGISFSDFVLLDLLAQTANGRVRIVELVRPLGLPQSAVLRQLIVLEKIGLVGRDGASDERYAVLRPAGRVLANTAHETADSICSKTVSSIAPATVRLVSTALVTLACAPALVLS